MNRGSWRELDTAIEEGGVLRSVLPGVDALFARRRRRGRSSSGVTAWDESCRWHAVEFRGVQR